MSMTTIHDTWNDHADAVTLIDAHHHLWDLTANHYPFLSDKPEPHFFLGDYGALRRNYMRRSSSFFLFSSPFRPTLTKRASSTSVLLLR